MSLLNKASLIQIPSGYKDGTLYSAKPTNGDGDFTFSRGSNLAATRVKDGLIEKGRENLLLRSYEFNNAYWNIDGVSATADTIANPLDGSVNADTLTTTSSGSGVEFRVRANTSMATSFVYSYSCYVKRIDYDYFYLRTLPNNAFSIFDINNGTITTQSAGHFDAQIEDVGSGWYRCSVSFITPSSFVNNLVDLGFSFSSSAFSGSIPTGRQMYVYGAQLEESLVATDFIPTTTTTEQAGILEDMPRLDYSGGATCGSLLLESQRTNIATNSEYMLDFTKGSASSLEANAATSPDGKNNATYYYCNTTTTNGFLYPSFNGTSGVQYAVSFYAKAKELSIVYIKNVNDSGAQSYFDLSDGTFTLNSGIDSMSIEDAGNGWYRCTAVSTSTTTGIKWIPILKGDANEGVYVYGLQIEQASYPTSYIPTYGSSVTRGDENSIITSATDIIGQTEGTMFYEFNSGKNDGADYVISLSDGSTNNRIIIYRSSANQLIAQIRTGGSSVAQINTSTLTEDITYKVALGYANNDVVFYVNGSLIGSDTSASIPSTDRVATDNGVGSAIFGRPLNQLLLFKTRLSNDELATLTTI